MLKRTGTFIIMLTLPTLAASFPHASRATALPPPVKQEMGIFDAVFNDLSEKDCRECHGRDIATLHHATQPTCFNCHPSGANSISTDCLFCHEQQPGDASVHHLTETAQLGDCVACHRSLVQNRTDEHYIPSYPATMVTPRPSHGLGPDGRGSCKFCHDWGNDGATGALIFSNTQTHHETGFGLQGDKCVWCHGNLPGPELAIRPCEQCHAPLSIHNIQADSNGDGVIAPGGESACYGHIGSNDDCLGCHGGFGENTVTTGHKSLIDNPTRHHLMVQTKDKKCLDCHELILNQEGFFVFKNFRICSSCHGRRRN